MQKQELIHTSTFNITSAEIDMFKRLKMGNLINFLIQAAVNSVDELGFGFRNLEKHKLFWVLSRLTVEILKPIGWYQNLKVQTWAKGVNRIFYNRDFIVKNEASEIIAKATSVWLAIDIDNKRPKTLELEANKLFNMLSNKHALNYEPEKINDKAKNTVTTKECSYFDIDLNNHVTSSRYIDWIMDCFSVDFHKNNYPKKLSVNYLKEISPNSKIEINKTQINTKEFILDGTNLNNNKTSFKAKIQF